jgi:ankyrin repeat protein
VLLSDALSRGYDDIYEWFEYVDLAMVYAMADGNSAVLDSLTAAGAELDYDDDSTFHYAATSNCLTLVRQFLEHNKVRNALSSTTLGSAVKDAAAKGYTDVVKAIIESGINIQIIPDDTLCWTLQHRRTEAAMALIDAGVSVHGPQRGMSPLMGAAASGCADMVEYLIGKGVDVNYVYTYDHFRRTALSYASKPEIVKMLLDAGA